MLKLRNTTHSETGLYTASYVVPVRSCHQSQAHYTWTAHSNFHAYPIKPKGAMPFSVRRVWGNHASFFAALTLYTGSTGHSCDALLMLCNKSLLHGALDVIATSRFAPTLLHPVPALRGFLPSRCPWRPSGHRPFHLPDRNDPYFWVVFGSHSTGHPCCAVSR
jgi:hypothetical protein